MHFCYCLPGAACALLSDSMEEREITMNALRRIIDAIQRLDKLKDKQPILQELFDDLAFQKETYPLELMSMLVQSNFDPKDREIQKLLARTKTGTSTTKDILESAFSHLQSISFLLATTRIVKWGCTRSGCTLQRALTQRFRRRRYIRNLLTG